MIVANPVYDIVFKYLMEDERKSAFIMDTKKILKFLCEIANNNNRPWFQEHRAEYDSARQDFEQGVGEAIARIASFDAEVANITVKDTTYRFYRDTRFSPDKSPYKRHFGAYICAKGKKSLRGGYYIHLEPDHCLVAVGSYWLPTNILTACRNELLANEELWLNCVENKEFLSYYGAGEDADWDSPQGFGMSRLKTCPSGFPRDYEHMRYLRQKDYCAWHCVPSDFFGRKDWLDELERMFRAAKPMMDFMNAVIDDYE